MKSEPDWVSQAKVVWGEEWVSPMARAIGKSLRTVQRWKANALQTGTMNERRGEPSADVKALIRSLAKRIEDWRVKQGGTD